MRFVLIRQAMRLAKPRGQGWPAAAQPGNEGYHVPTAKIPSSAPGLVGFLKDIPSLAQELILGGGMEKVTAAVPFQHGNPPHCGYFPFPLKPEETEGFAFPPQWDEEITFLLIPS